MTIYAITEDNLVREIFDAGDLVLGVDILTKELADRSVDITDVVPQPDVGWSAILEDGVWTFSEPVIPQPTDQQLKDAAMSKRNNLLQYANEQTLGMSDAYIAGLLTAEEEAMYKAWAAYKLLLNKIDKQTNYPKTINWPIIPE